MSQDNKQTGRDRSDDVSKSDGGGRTGGGESGGGAYKDPSQAKGNPDEAGPDGRSSIGYHGPGDAVDDDDNPNAATRAE
ncbi:hypothetical protein G4G27_15340 [Sphingomonas sp. So64.6b]|uniref:hypothetical protein n=1 Tax=Sphingomonas sp. So64.6b TaxID=2997354 RepID=UPI0015FFE677|nr:hypothetical protein [Sphingomonas sp. So64.6b]QNA85219.1 hypothetical protein G4G27_15340 [Sphingomonas sp. So64.6b]